MTEDTPLSQIAKRVKELVEGEDQALSQSNIMLLGALDEFLPELQSKEDLLWFTSKEARKTGSCARKLISCATESLKTLEVANQAKVLCLAVALGGHTLK